MVFLNFAIVIAGAFSYALMSALIKLMSSQANQETILFSRFFIALVLLLPIYLVSGRPKISTRRPWLHALRAILGFGMFALYTLALRNIPLENAMVLNSAYPLFIPLILYITTKERLSIMEAVGISIGFSGVYLVLHPGPVFFIQRGTVFALLSALCSAGANVTIRFLRSTENSFSILLYFFLLSTILSAFSLPGRFCWPSGTQRLLLVAIGVLSVVSQQCLAYSLKFLHPNIVSSLMFSSILFGLLFSWILSGNPPRFQAMIGIPLIMTGAAVILQRPAAQHV